jgi:hypothetical protein
MRSFGGFCIALLLAGGLLAQTRTTGGTAPFVTGGFGNILYPAGTPATNPGIVRYTPNIVFPGGGGPRLVVPGSKTYPAVRNNFGTPLVYGYPVYVGGYGGYDPSAYGAAQAPAQQQQPNVTVIYPPQPAPVIINQFGPQDAPERATPQMNVYQPEPAAPAAVESAPADTAPHYLIAFKDHTIYSAVAYWVDGDTLHYFTSGNTHNQASVALVDRALTERLNKESGNEIKLPPAN